MGKITLNKFSELVENGESREHPGKAAGYIIIHDSDGEETFYTEWLYHDIKADDDGEITPDGWAEIEKQDAEHLPTAYDKYITSPRNM